MIKLGNFARKPMDLSVAASTANQLLSSGRNVLNRNNLNALSSWESNPVGNLKKGINQNTNIGRQIGVGGNLNNHGIK